MNHVISSPLKDQEPMGVNQGGIMWVNLVYLIMGLTQTTGVLG